MACYAATSMTGKTRTPCATSLARPRVLVVCWRGPQQQCRLNLPLTGAAPRTGGLLHAIWPGTMLLLLWFAFATLYFGSPLPNTFYAKLMADYPTAQVLARSMDYFAVQLERDPGSLVIILVALLLAALKRNQLGRILALGQLLVPGFYY